jgi:hypothetical protein
VLSKAFVTAADGRSNAAAWLHDPVCTRSGHSFRSNDSRDVALEAHEAT